MDSTVKALREVLAVAAESGLAVSSVQIAESGELRVEFRGPKGPEERPITAAEVAAEVRRQDDARLYGASQGLNL